MEGRNETAAGGEREVKRGFLLPNRCCRIMYTDGNDLVEKKSDVTEERQKGICIEEKPLDR